MIARMADDFLALLLGNTARARVLRVFIFNQGPLTLSIVAKRAGVSPSVAEKETRFLEQLGVIKKGKFTITLKGSAGRIVAGKHKEDAWILDPQSTHALALSKFVHEISPVKHDIIVEKLKSSGKLAAVVLSGIFVGDPSRPADLLIAADSINEERLERSVKALEPLYGREIRYAVFTTLEFRYRLTIQDRLIRDTLDYPHLVLLDKTGLL